MLALMRRTAAIPVLAVSAVLVAGCGGGGGHTAAKTSMGSAAVKATPATVAPGAARPAAAGDHHQLAAGRPLRFPDLR